MFAPTPAPPQRPPPPGIVSIQRELFSWQPSPLDPDETQAPIHEPPAALTYEELQVLLLRQFSLWPEPQDQEVPDVCA